MTGAALIRADSLALPLADRSVHLSISSPPYFALRSYQDGGEHYAGQIGSEPSPTDFLRALWRVYDEVYRTLRDDGSCFVNLGDKYAGSGGHNNANVSRPPSEKSTLNSRRSLDRMGMLAQAARDAGRTQPRKATRRSAPDRYNQASDVLAKSLMGLPWRFAMGLIDPLRYRDPIDPPDTCWHDEQPCTACRSGWPQWILRAELVWSKPNGMPESVCDRVRRSHEQWFHFVKAGRYYSAIDEVREGYAASTQAAYDDGTIAKRIGKGYTTHPSFTNRRSQDEFDDDYSGNPLGRVPGSVLVLDDEPIEVPAEVAVALGLEDSATVWSIASEPLRVPDRLEVDHFAAFPQEWPRRLIVGWSPPGICTVCGDGRRPVVDKAAAAPPRSRVNRNAAEAVTGGQPTDTEVSYTITGYACACESPDAPTTPAVVLDPFGGTGTVAMVARALGRYGVHIDLSADYLRLARWRVFESGHAAKSATRTNAERKRLGVKPVDMPPADDSLFGVM